MKSVVLSLVIGIGAVQAAPLPQYVPGGAPCAGACKLDWAQKEWSIPEGKPYPVLIPRGSHIRYMSYAKDGKPLWQTKPMVFAQDTEGVGYWFEGPDGKTNLMAKIDECQNWTVVVPPQPDLWSDPILDSPAIPAGHWFETLPNPYRGWPYASYPCCGGSYVPPDTPEYPKDPIEPTEPPQVPLPTSWLLLVSAILLLIRLRTHARV